MTIMDVVSPRINPWRLPPPIRPHLASMRSVAEDVCAEYGLTLTELRGRSRVFRVAHPRQDFMARAYDLPHTSLPMIGRWLGGRDHSTIHSGIKAHEARSGNQ